MMLEDLTHLEWNRTKDIQIAVVIQSFTRIVAKARRIFNTTTLKERSESQFEMLPKWNVPQIIIGGI